MSNVKCFLVPKFIYTARNQAGKTQGGEVVAENEKKAVEQLRAEGLLVTSIQLLEKKKGEVNVAFFNRLFSGVPVKDKMMLARNLSVMIASGLTLSSATKNMEAQTKNQHLRKILSNVGDDLQSGKTFSDSLAEYPLVFSDLFVNMIRVGETGGNLEEVLKILAEQLEKEYDLRRKIKGALIYPAVIIVAMIGIGILMLTYILPKITGVFQDMEVELPVTTQFVIGISDFLRHHSILVVLGAIATVFFARVFLQTESGKKILSWFLISFPSVKGIVVKVNCARFSRIYSSLLKSGVPVVEALQIVSNTLTNYYYKITIKNSIEEIQKGVELSKIIAKDEKIFPPLVSQMLEVGEETGKTEDVMVKLAEFYEDEVDQITKNLSSIIEPILMLLIGGAVGFFAVSMLQPMYSVLENIQ